MKGHKHALQSCLIGSMFLYSSIHAVESSSDLRVEMQTGSSAPGGRNVHRVSMTTDASHDDLKIGHKGRYVQKMDYICKNGFVKNPVYLRPRSFVIFNSIHNVRGHIRRQLYEN